VPLLCAGVAALGALGIFQMTPSATAASLVQVTNFGNNPSGLQMYIYVPNNVTANPPILLALHQCTGSGPGFFSGTQFSSLADQYGFIVIYPSVTRSGSCWDVSSSQALTRNGGSDPVGLMSMITYTEQHYGGNPNAVDVTGASSGAMMTNVMLADYPDVFKAGAAFMGVPYYCFFTGTVDGWNSACANGQVSMTAQAWGNLVRNADPGYSGPRPRMQLWHGTADGTLNYNNFGQEILQWTNVLGVSSTPVSTTTPVSGWTETMYGSTSNPAVEGFSIAGAGHVLPETGMAAYAISFFGLNGAPPPPPTTSPPPTSPPPSSPPPGGSCHVSYVKTSEWAGGFVANVTINDTGTAAINGWRLTFTFPGDQVVTNAWSATVTQNGTSVTAVNASYDAAISPGGNVSFGMQGTWKNNDTAPASFSLNGTPCS
jgi:poly(hydroxyalkanoate) depolymerase family esterase